MMTTARLIIRVTILVLIWMYIIGIASILAFASFVWLAKFLGLVTQ